MVSQQLECPVCFIRFDTERQAGQSVTCPSCDNSFNTPDEEKFPPEAAPTAQVDDVEEETTYEATEEEAPDNDKEPESDEAEEEAPQNDEILDREPEDATNDEEVDAEEAPETGEPDDDEPSAPPDATSPGALVLLGELSTAYHTKRLQSVIDGPRSRAQLAGLLLLAVAVLGLLAATATAVKWNGYDSPW
ncbi:MAG: hypothetical protein VX686_00195, partial [Candidatus Thermoplasmatota archaeon]|nr:hypothetical protein [Candidatus Thermoplasmatota archaeon]